jgi:DNA polymerase I-like protein with 3'-5' exonuclease and polymerase domains
MARYDDGAYCDIILNGDIHTANMEALGITDRDVAKTFIYAFLYGAGVSKLAKILKVSDQKATVIKKNFLASFPALAELLLAVKSACARGYLLGLDGRHIPVRSEHAALNTLLQGAGALIMKRALVISAPNVYASGAEFVANIHDEFQVESDSRFSIAVGEYLVKGIVEAGEYYNFRCPLDGEYKIGKTWAETH